MKKKTKVLSAVLTQWCKNGHRGDWFRIEKWQEFECRVCGATRTYKEVLERQGKNERKRKRRAARA